MKSIIVKNLYKSFYIRDNKKTSLKELATALFNQGKTKEFKALQDISFSIEKGTFVSIIGRNGSGKSTLLKIISGIFSQDSGITQINGSVVPLLELGVGFNPELTGVENMFLNGTLMGMSTKYIRERYDHIIEFAEIGDFIHMPIKNYSSGMKVRLAFAIAIQANADIYILDEVFSVGDVGFQTKSKKVMEDLVKEGKTILYVSHGIGTIKKYSDSVIWLENGKIKYNGQTEKGLKLYQESLNITPK